MKRYELRKFGLEQVTNRIATAAFGPILGLSPSQVREFMAPYANLISDYVDRAHVNRAGQIMADLKEMQQDRVALAALADTRSDEEKEIIHKFYKRYEEQCFEAIKAYMRADEELPEGKIPQTMAEPAPDNVRHVDFVNTAVASTPEPTKVVEATKVDPSEFVSEFHPL